VRAERLADRQHGVHHDESLEVGAEARIDWQGEAQRRAPVLRDQRDVLQRGVLGEAQ
jgi:hypothetical protein